MNRIRHINRRNRQGAIIVLFAILLPILLVILGFAVDYAYIQKTRTEVRVVADLGAKAAADSLARTDGDVDAAIAAAQQVASSNYVAGKALTLPADQIIFGRANRQRDGSFAISEGQTPFNSVRVVAERAVGSPEGPGRLFFGQLYGAPTFDTVQTATSSFRDVEVVLVLDRSGSMKYEVEGTPTIEEKQLLVCSVPSPTSRWNALDAAVASFLGELDASQVQERVGLVTFASEGTQSCGENTLIGVESSLDTPLSTDLNLIRAEMNRRKSEVWIGGTNIRAGLNLARTHFAAHGSESVEQVIICLTDGVHNQGEGPLPEAILCYEAGIKIHTITFGEDAEQVRMQEVANETGGEHFHAPDAKTLRRVFKRLAGSFAILTQ